MKNILLGASALALATTASAQFTQVFPAANPLAAANPAMCFDAFNGVSVLFGGDVPGGPFGAVTDQTYIYDGNTWTNVSPVTGPGGRAGCKMVYDANAGFCVMYGGAAPGGPFGPGPGIDETWLWDGISWTQVFPINSPGGLTQHDMAYDSSRGRTVLYGGTDNPTFPIYLDQTWEFDGFTWTQMTPANNPGPLERPAMCYHAGLQRTVLFGGFDPQNFTVTGGSDDVWLWDGVNWTTAPITGVRPPVLADANLSYDSVTQRILMTGGYDPNSGFAGAQDTTWELDLSTNSWTQINDSFTTQRRGSGLAFDIGRRQHVLYGGSGTGFGALLGDTWEYSHRSVAFGNGCLGSNGVPTLSANGAPTFGQLYELNMTGLNAALNLGVLAFSNGNIPGGLDLGGLIGMTGCTAYVPADILVTVGGAGGNATWSATMPTTPSLLDSTLFAQLYSFDPGVNPFNFVNSNAHRGTLGN